MKKFNDIIAHLSNRHQVALTWYFERTGQLTLWPDPLIIPDGLTYLATRAKGIYKPEWSVYALSIRQSMNSPYPDKEPIPRTDGTWFYSYFQENSDLSARDSKYTNRALLKCWRDKVPIGVFRQIEGKPKSKYIILGVALVVGWEGGYYFIEGFSPEGYCRPYGSSGNNSS